MNLELDGSHVLVLGLGVSGRAAARFCAERGARVLAVDESPKAAPLEGVAGVECVVGQPFPDPAPFDLVVPSPGVPPARYRGAREALCDVELAFRALSVPVVAITGTNGKSSVTRLVEAMLRSAGLRARAAGNLGESALSLVGEALDVAVLEVSSFQLETTDRFRPSVAVILNATPDHLDRHGSFEAYVEAKARILANQQSGDSAVLSADDPIVRGLAERARGRVLFFSAERAVESGVVCDAGSFVLCERDAAPRRIPAEGPRLAAPHERENAAAALAAAWATGADPARAAGARAGFEGLPHRLEPVAEIAGVRFVNDSKATNPGAALRALAAQDAPIVWIAGGRDKQLDFGPLAEAAARRARAAVLIGEAAGTLKDALAGRLPVHAAASLEEAVRCAARLADPGDVVLLAPACASQDQFRDFEERGERFRAAVAALREERR